LAEVEEEGRHATVSERPRELYRALEATGMMTG
jgi:hypothetical protein